MKRRGFLKGLLASAALGLTLSAGSAFRLEPAPLLLEKQLSCKFEISPMEDGISMYSIDLEEKLAAQIHQQLMKEWGRLVADDIRYIAKKVPWYRRALSKLHLT